MFRTSRRFFRQFSNRSEEHHHEADHDDDNLVSRYDACNKILKEMFKSKSNDDPCICSFFQKISSNYNRSEINLFLSKLYHQNKNYRENYLNFSEKKKIKKAEKAKALDEHNEIFIKLLKLLKFGFDQSKKTSEEILESLDFNFDLLKEYFSSEECIHIYFDPKYEYFFGIFNALSKLANSQENEFKKMLGNKTKAMLFEIAHKEKDQYFFWIEFSSNALRKMLNSKKCSKYDVGSRLVEIFNIFSGDEAFIGEKESENIFNIVAQEKTQYNFWIQWLTYVDKKLKISSQQTDEEKVKEKKKFFSLASNVLPMPENYHPVCIAIIKKMNFLFFHEKIYLSLHCLLLDDDNQIESLRYLYGLCEMFDDKEELQKNALYCFEAIFKMITINRYQQFDADKIQGKIKGSFLKAVYRILFLLKKYSYLSKHNLNTLHRYAPILFKNKMLQAWENEFPQFTTIPLPCIENGINFNHINLSEITPKQAEEKFNLVFKQYEELLIESNGSKVKFFRPIANSELTTTVKNSNLCENVEKQEARSACVF